MTSSDTLGRYPALLAGLLALGAFVVATAGCDPPSSRRLMVATRWPLAERVRLESELQKWSSSSRLDPGHEPIDLDWLILRPATTWPASCDAGTRRMCCSAPVPGHSTVWLRGTADSGGRPGFGSLVRRPAIGHPVR